MVEHRTENSGVGGSIPFIGSMAKFYLLVFNYLSTRNSKTLVVGTNKMYNTLWIVNINNVIRMLCVLIKILKQPISESVLLSKYRSEVSITTNTIGYNAKTVLHKVVGYLPWWGKWYLLSLKFLPKPGKSNKNFFWFARYLQLYMQAYTSLKLDWLFLNLLNLTDTSLFLLWWHKLYTSRTLSVFFCSSIKFFYILTNIIFFKNIDYFVKLIQVIITQAPLKFHKRHFYRVKIILNYIFRLLKPYNKMCGYSIFFKGKLGRKGSVKKSTFFYKTGRVSYTNKSLRVNFRKFLVYTETGVVGCGISLFF